MIERGKGNRERGRSKVQRAESKELSALFSLMDLSDQKTNIQEFQNWISQNEFDFKQLGQLAADHHLRPWLYSFYKQLPVGVVPEEAMEVYERLENQIRLRQLKHIREFFKIKERLDEEEIVIIPFKGFRLAEGYYGNMTLRESSDLDVLVRIRDLKRIIEIMGELGYVSETDFKARKYPFSHIINLGPEYNMDLWENGQRIAHVELHWQISGPPLNIGCFYEEMEEFVSEDDFQGKRYSCLTPEGDLLMAAFHHGGKEEWIRLGHILDIGQILNKYPNADYGKAIEWAEQKNISRIVLTGIQLAHEHCQVPIPESIKEKVNAPGILSLAQNRVKKIRHLAASRSSLPFRFNSTIYHLSSRDTFPAQIRLALEFPIHFFRRALLKLQRTLRLAN